MLPRLLLLLSLLTAFLLPGLTRAEIVDRCVAVVNDDIITLSEVNEAGKPLFQRIAEQAPPGQLGEALKQARKSVIQKLIDKKIMAQEAKKYKLTVSDDEVDRALKRILERNHTSMQQFREELARIGMNEKQYREDLRDQILRSKLVNLEVRSKVIIPESKIIDYYDQHYTEQVGNGGYYILQIGVNPAKQKTDDPDKARQLARQKIEKIRAMALAGQDFRKLARQYSDLPSAVDGGDIGVFREEEMAPVMRKAVTRLKPGEISPVVETPDGFQIYKLLSSQEGQIITKVPYETVKEDIRETLYEQEMKKLYDQWMKKMRDQSYIKIL